MSDRGASGSHQSGRRRANTLPPPSLYGAMGSSSPTIEVRALSAKLTGETIIALAGKSWSIVALCGISGAEQMPTKRSRIGISSTNTRGGRKS